MPKKKTPSSPDQFLVPVQLIEQRIYFIRGQKVMLDSDLAELYEVETRAVVQAIKRNPGRFPEDFIFQLTKEEHESLRSQIVISKVGRGGRRYPPYAFTEQGIAMLSSVLNSERAIQVNIVIMRTFVRLRQLIASNEEIAKKLNELELNTSTKLKLHGDQIRAIFEAIKKLIKAQLPKAETPKRPIGFKADDKKKI
jgi:hypothetical protein